jgi:hypothetical protein
MTWHLTAGELAATTEKVEKLNARAAKRGWTGRIELASTRREEERVDEFTGFRVTEVWYDTEITGDAPCYGGWRFVATLDWDRHAGLIVRTAPGVESVDREGLREDWCDHCQTKRYRAKTMLVRNVETGEQRQVGSTCIKDFLGWDKAPVFIYTDGIKEGVDEFIGGFGAGGERDYSVETILSIAWAATMAFGFVPTSSHWDTPTAGVVRNVLNPPKNARYDRGWQDMVAKLATFAEDAARKAADVRAWIASDEFSGTSEYVLNMKAAAAADLASPRNIGLLASAPQAWAKHCAKTLVRKAREGQPSEWFGAKGDKVTFTGVIEGIHRSEQWFGYSCKTTTIYTIRNAEDGRIVKWFASNPTLGQDEGVTVTITGTVKGHEEFREIKSTLLTRCKLISSTPAAA